MVISELFTPRRINRPWYMETEFHTAWCGVLWASIVLFTQQSMADRPVMVYLGFWSDDTWALLMGVCAISQLFCVFLNCTLCRWIVSIPLTALWAMVIYGILKSCLVRGEDLPFALGLYIPCFMSMFFRVAHLPREYPPRG